MRSPLGMGGIAGEHFSATLTYEHGLTATLLHHRPEAISPGAGMELLGTAGRVHVQGRAAWWLPRHPKARGS